MNKTILEVGSASYTYNYTNINENGIITMFIMKGNYLIAWLQYIPCGDNRYDYNILSQDKYIKDELIEELLDKFTEMVVK